MVKIIFRIFLICIIIISSVTCSPSKKAAATATAPASTPATVQIVPTASTVVSHDPEDAFFENIFKNYPGLFDSVLQNREAWNVQVIYTEINRDASGRPELTDHYFNRAHAKYFYPASTVKFPVALLALQRANELAANGININKHTAMITHAAYGGQSPVYNDPNTFAGIPAIAQYVKKILLVSDNDAFNRLYEFLGQEYINAELQKKGYASAQILHRLDIFLTEDENRHTNPVSFYDSVAQLIYARPMLFNKQQYAKRSDYIGKGYYSNGKYIDRPMVFSAKNRISLSDLHKVLRSVIFPETVKASERFNITEDDRQLVLKNMSAFPRESVFPFYDDSYDDAYGKFIFYGGEKGIQQKNIRVFDKSGNAYGQLIDVAYVVDYQKKIEFMVSAAIYCNSDGILNDDKYDYDNIGLPFLKNLGRVLYDHELNRQKKYLPDLSSFMFTYDK